MSLSPIACLPAISFNLCFYAMSANATLVLLDNATLVLLDDGGDDDQSDDTVIVD